MSNDPDAKLSILAHSFGSYIVAEILADRPDIVVHRLAFCGSIVPHNHRFIRQLGPRIRTQVVNDVGSKDFWPALANSVTTGYGQTGTYGFQRPLVTDRRFEGLGHSDFLNPAFCKKYWIPFFKTGSFEPDETGQEKPVSIKEVHVSSDGKKPFGSPPLLIRVISVPVFKIKFWALLGALGFLTWWSWDYLPQILARICT
jgi:hypothetical protein